MCSNLSWAFQNIVSSLEKKITTKDKKSEQAWSLETNLPAAANWFVFASEDLLTQGDKVETKYFDESELGEWKGKGFSRERWAFWKHRLEKLTTSELLSEETKEATRKAVVNMGKAERTKK